MFLKGFHELDSLLPLLFNKDIPIIRMKILIDQKTADNPIFNEFDSEITVGLIVLW